MVYFEGLLPQVTPQTQVETVEDIFRETKLGNAPLTVIKDQMLISQTGMLEFIINLCGSTPHEKAIAGTAVMLTYMMLETQAQIDALERMDL